MSNFFTEVLNDLDGLEQDLLGPDYSYYKEIKSPQEFVDSSRIASRSRDSQENDSSISFDFPLKFISF